MIVGNLFDDVPETLRAEWTEVLARGGGARVERIVSRGHSSPEGFWYDQDAWEWVTVVKGRARVMFEGERDSVSLGPGDHLTIPPRTRHRVQWTDPDEDTVWVAVHYLEAGTPEL